MASRSDDHKALLNERTENAMERYGFLTEEFKQAAKQEQNNEKIEGFREKGDSSIEREVSLQPTPPEELSR